MADISKFNVVIGADISGLQKSLGKVQSSLSSFGKRATQMGKNLSMSLTAPIAGLGTLAVREFAKVDKSLREVNTLFGLSGEAADKSFKEMKAGVRDLSAELGIAQKTISDGLYQAVSAGVPKDNVFDFMRVASQASVAGVTDVETAVDGLSTIINAFGLEASQAQEVADSMFATVKGGKTDFSQLSASLFNVAPAAAAAGVSFKDANAAIATLTASGTPTSVAATQIRAAMTALTKPSEELTAIFQQAGYESGELALRQAGLQRSMQIVQQATGGSTAKMTELLGRVEAVNAVNVLAGTSASKFTQELNNQRNAAGATATAFGEMEKSASKQFEKLQVRIQNLGIQIGEALLPIVQKMIGFVQKAVSFFSRMSSTGKQVTMVVIGLAAAIGPAVTVLGSMATAISFIVSPIGLVIAGIAALTAAIIYVADNWDGIVERISDWGWWRNMLLDMISFLIEYNPISLIIKGINEVLKFAGKNPIPNLYENVADGIERLKGETNDYENELGSFSDAVGNAMNKVQGLFGSGGGGGGMTPSKAQTQTTSESTDNRQQGLSRMSSMQPGGQEGVQNVASTPLGQALTQDMALMDEFNTKMDEMTTRSEMSLNELQNAAQIVGNSVGQAFSKMGARMSEALGEGETGMQRFLNSFVTSALEIISQALSVSIANAIMGATSAGSATGPAAPFTTPAFIAQMVGAVIGAFASIPSFARGGLVPGTSYSGDNVMAAVNSGEMILNTGQQNKLFSMLNGGGSGMSNVQFEIRGSDLIGTIDRENRRRTARQ